MTEICLKQGKTSLTLYATTSTTSVKSLIIYVCMYASLKGGKLDDKHLHTEPDNPELIIHVLTIY